MTVKDLIKKKLEDATADTQALAEFIDGCPCSDGLLTYLGIKEECGSYCKGCEREVQSWLVCRPCLIKWLNKEINYDSRS